jgi:hypothetical protein
MSLTIYLDDCVDDNLLIAALQKEGFKVLSPRGVGTAGWSDEAHLEFCAQQGFAILTANADDFHDLHEEWQRQGKHHAGIIAICREKDVRKHMRIKDIVSALKKLLKAHRQLGLLIANEFIVLNHWR